MHFSSNLKKEVSGGKNKDSNTQKSQPMDILDFITLQTAYGNFEIKKYFENFEVLMKEMPEEIRSLEEIDDSVKEAIWSTIIALAFMETTYSDIEDEWILIADKATRYIKKSIQGKSLEIDILKVIAKEVIISLNKKK